MTPNLLESMQQQLTPDMIQHVSSFLGETPAHTQTAVDESISTVLAGLLHLSSSGAGPIQLLNLINQANYGSLLNNLSGLLEGGNTTQNLMTAGQEILGTLFAGKLNAVSELIATTSGVTNTSASSLLSIVAPVVVGVLGRVRAMQGLNAVRLATLLTSQKEGIVKLAPEGLARVFGLNSLVDQGLGLSAQRQRAWSRHVETRGGCPDEREKHAEKLDLARPCPCSDWINLFLHDGPWRRGHPSADGDIGGWNWSWLKK